MVPVDTDPARLRCTTKAIAMCELSLYVTPVT